MQFTVYETFLDRLIFVIVRTTFLSLFVSRSNNARFEGFRVISSLSSEYIPYLECATKKYISALHIFWKSLFLVSFFLSPALDVFVELGFYLPSSLSLYSAQLSSQIFIVVIIPSHKSDAFVLERFYWPSFILLSTFLTCAHYSFWFHHPFSHKLDVFVEGAFYLPSLNSSLRTPLSFPHVCARYSRLTSWKGIFWNMSPAAKNQLTASLTSSGPPFQPCPH